MPHFHRTAQLSELDEALDSTKTSLWPSAIIDSSLQTWTSKASPEVDLG